MDEDAIINDPGHPNLPSNEELLAAIENMGELDEETKRLLREGILKDGAEGILKAFQPPSAEEVAAAANSGNMVEMVMLLGMIALVLLALVFFGYKLYKSLVERERRKEEKKRQKQQKKKK